MTSREKREKERGTSREKQEREKESDQQRETRDRDKVPIVCSLWNAVINSNVFKLQSSRAGFFYIYIPFLEKLILVNLLKSLYSILLCFYVKLVE